MVISFTDRNVISNVMVCLDEPSFIEEKSFVNAPLNSRVPLQSAASSKGKGKAKAKAESLEKVPVEIQEALVLEDLLFVLMVSCVRSIHVVAFANEMC